MKFAIRDDDLNWFYTPDFIDENLRDIWNICPVSMSVIPFVKGNWKKNTALLESLGSDNISINALEEIKNDTKIYPIAENIKLVQYVKDKILDGKIYITIHGIHHRNEDNILPVIKNNFPIGAEFCTSKDLGDELLNACHYLEEIFEQEIRIFSPPQNIINGNGYAAIEKAELDICGYLPSLKEPFIFIRNSGFLNYLQYFKHKIQYKGTRTPYPKTITWGYSEIIEHCCIQPNSNIEIIKKAIDNIYELGGDFVLSTHSYAFKQTMNNYPFTMGEAVMLILEYAADKKFEFVTINKILNTKNKV